MNVPLSDETSPEERRLSKYSNADRSAAYSQALGSQGAGTAVASREAAAEAPLEHLIEHIIRDGGLDGAILPSEGEQRRSEEPLFESQSGGLPPKLLEELRAGQEETRAQAQIMSRAQAAVAIASLPQTSTTSPAAAGLKGLRQRLRLAAAKYASRGASSLWRIGRALLPLAAAAGRASFRGSIRLMRAMRIRQWYRRYLIFLTALHRLAFDRRVERLLFIKTPPFPFFPAAKEPNPQFHYQGPIPRKVLDWAMSALPGDLKHYAFVDFRAERGRTLLLAARRNFEYAAGYAFDSESCEQLELNLAQYPRSYMSCRDVRAMRGDRDGVVIPEQPAVLFFSEGVSDSHLEIIMNYASASYRLSPRPIYLIFEKSGRERALEQMELFEKVRLPIFNHIKASLFSPAKVAVYRSKASASEA
jgi:hypothetical protein